ncbi:MAG: ABC transporter transmembrane domain-containing protein, partial [Elusimicrobiales bacterium]
MSIRRLLKWLSEYWFKHRYRMLFIVILGIISAYIQAAMPFYIKKIINGFEFSMTRDYVIKNVFVLLILGFASFIINLFAQRNRAYMNYRIEYEIRKKTFLHILKLDEFFFYRFSQGDIITRLIDDISEKIAWFSCSGVFRFVQAVFTLIAV